MSKVAKAAVGLMIVTMISKVLGFAREQVLSFAYGTSLYADIYLTAMNIPTVIFASIGAALSTTFIPIYCDIERNLNKDRANKFMNNILGIVILICLCLAGIGLVFTEPLVKIFAVGFKGETLNIAVRFTKILIFGILSIGISNILTGYLQFKNNFVIPGLISLPQNIIVIISIILSMKFGPYVMVWGTLLGMFSQCLFLLPFAIKSGYRISPYINVKDEHIKKMICLVGPVFIGVAVNQINTMVDRTLASTLVEGSISALNYANRLNGFVLGLFITSIGAVIYPTLSKLTINSKNEEFKYFIMKSINVVMILVIPISVGAIVLSKPIVEILFQRGAFDANATKMTSVALIMYSIGTVPFGLRDVLGKVFYSLQDTKTPMVNGSISMILNIILNLILVKYMGHAGLAFATSLSSIICIIMLFRSLKKKIGDFNQKSILVTFVKSIVASMIMGIITYLLFNYMITYIGYSLVSKIIALVISIMIGAISYLFMIILLKVDEIKDILKKLNR